LSATLLHGLVFRAEANNRLDQPIAVLPTLLKAAAAALKQRRAA
jgi:hypothetical protein